MQSIGQVIRRRRLDLGRTLAQLADAAGCSKAYLSMLENGRHANPPRAHLLASIERALDFAPGQLRRLAEWQTTPPT